MKNRTFHFLPSCLLAFFLGPLVFPPSTCSAASLFLDKAFRAPFFGQINPAGQSLLLPDGKFLLFGKTDSLAAQRTGPLIRFLADGTLDSSFNFSHEYSSIAAVAALSNGQLIVSAIQTTYGSASTEQILRVNGDGSIDPTFASLPVETRTYATVEKIIEQPDGKILIVGFFDEFAGLPRQKIVRLLGDGIIDSGFNPPSFLGGFGLWARPVLLGDGKMLVGGDFTTLNGNASLGLARLNSDGSLDSTFQPSGFIRSSGSPIRAIVFQSDGKIVMGGRFQLSFPTRRVPLFRLNAGGSADNSFAYTIQATAYDLVVRPNDKLLAAVSGTFGGTVYQFSADGTIDSAFPLSGFVNNTSSQVGAGTPNSVGLFSDGRMLVGGTFTHVAANSVGHPRFGVARFNLDGTLDPALSNIPKTGYSTYPQAFIRLPDQSTLAAFGAEVEPATPSNLARFLADGSLDSTFQLTSSDPKSIVASGFLALTLTPLADGNLFISGYPPDSFLRIGKFGNDGTEELGFPSSYEAFRVAIALPNGKSLLSAGSDPQYVLTGILTRRQASGVYDSGFSLDPSVTSAQVIRMQGFLNAMHVGSRVLAVQPDGKVLFAYLSGSDEQFHLVRLTTGGYIDATFSETVLVPAELTFGFPFVYDPYTNMTLQPPGGVYQAVSPVADAHVLSDGRILLVGRFLTFAGTAARGMIRLLEDGTVDPTFSAGDGAQWTETTETAAFYPGIEKIAEEVGGDFLIAGTFEAFDGTPLPGIARVHPDGSVDSSFTPVAKRLKFSSGTAQLERQPDGSFFLSGPYAFPNETEPSFIHINSLGGIPVIGSAALAAVRVGQSFDYQIVASGQPTSYQAAGLPAAFLFNTATGLITGTPTTKQVGTYQVVLTATNATGTSAPCNLTLRIPDTLQISSVVSRKVHGSVGSFDVDLPLTGSPGVECRSSNGHHTLVFIFNNDVSRAQGVLTKGQANSSGDPIIDGTTVAATLYNVADQQQITFNLTGLTDVYGQAMPDVAVNMNILVGDTNGNKTVSSSDVAQTKSQSGASVSAGNFRTDVNASGIVTASDIAQVKANSGHTLP